MRRHRVLCVVVAAILTGCASGGGHRTVSNTTTSATGFDPASTTISPSTSGTGEVPSSSSSSSPTATGPGVAPTVRPPVRTTGPTSQVPTRPTACVLGPQGPPSSTITANFATALAFAPDGRLFFAERSGAVRVVQDGQVRLFATVPTVTTEAGGGYSERGLLGLAIDPGFAQNHFVYAAYSDQDHVHQNIVRWSDCVGVASSPTIIVRLPSGPDCCHKGGRLAFGPDGRLYTTLGEERFPAAAQDTADVRGKVLRYNPDGTVPGDNPFGPGNPVYAFGFRNPFGLAFSATGQMAVTNNGPSGETYNGMVFPQTGFDTLVASVTRGSGYQWPVCFGYGHPGPCPTGQPGPDWSSEAGTVVPTGAAFVNAPGPTGYAGFLVFCSFAGGMKILRAQGMVSDGPSECRLDVKQGPDHALYYSDVGHIYRLA